MTPREAWRVLKIAATADAGAVRKAYAACYKALDPDADPHAYERLRDARDAALRDARRRAEMAQADAAEPVEPPAEDADDAPPAEWPHGAPRLTLDGGEGLLAVPLPRGELAEFAPVARGFAPSQQGGAPLPADPFALPELAGDDPALAGKAVQPGKRHDARLSDLLYLNGQEDDTPLTEDELIEARACLAEVVRDAHGGNLAQQEMIEDWLANVLAGSWPRSAPLVDAAAGQFGWMREAGQLGERPVISYLNARLRGYRFQNKVVLPDHPLHRAWVELARPGRAGPFKWLRASRDDVKRLLECIRKNFPEVEYNLDDQRIASWEAGQQAGGGPNRWLWAFGLVMLLRLLIAFGQMDAPSVGGGAPLPVLTQLDPDQRQLADAAVARAIGGGGTLNSLRGLQPDLASIVQANVKYGQLAGESSAESLARIEAIIRERGLEVARRDGGQVLNEAMRIRLGQLRAARKAGVAQCTALLKEDRLAPQVVLTPAQIAAEQQFLGGLVTAGRLVDPGDHQARSARVPGKLVGQVIDTSGLGEARVRAAMQGKGSDADKCDVHIALLAAALDWPGKERADILKTL